MLLPSLLDRFLPWLHQYGSLAIFFWFALGIFALPIPEESLLLLLGYLMAKGKLAILSSLIAAYVGSCCGISGSYVLGIATGHYLSQTWGRYIGLTEKRYQLAHNWFERVGKWALVIGYFIPGVRHLTGYVAGGLRLPWRYFVLFAYSGALVWVSLFIGAGYVFHAQETQAGSVLHLLLKTHSHHSDVMGK
jgi:membrane protein DedA with SNARE-associated domain